MNNAGSKLPSSPSLTLKPYLELQRRSHFIHGIGDRWSAGMGCQDCIAGSPMPAVCYSEQTENLYTKFKALPNGTICVFKIEMKSFKEIYWKKHDNLKAKGIVSCRIFLEKYFIAFSLQFFEIGFEFDMVPRNFQNNVWIFRKNSLAWIW